MNTDDLISLKLSLISHKVFGSSELTFVLLCPAGEHFAVFRGLDGKAYVVDAYCPHLGANLAVGGKVVGRSCIECPFHGWQFDGENGKCTRIPYAEKGDFRFVGTGVLLGVERIATAALQSVSAALTPEHPVFSLGWEGFPRVGDNE